jgi:hypothetical protein
MASPHFVTQLSAAIVVAVVFAAAQVSLAQPRPTAAERETARAMMQEGDELSAQGDLQAALVRYTAAHSLVNLPTTALEVARTQAKLGKLVEARGLALEVANSAPLKNEPPQFARARSAAAELAEDIAPRIPALRTEVNPPGTKYALTIDGAPVPKPAQAIAYRANPGTHVVTIAAAGFASQRKEVKLIERQTAILTVTLTPESAASAQPTQRPTQQTPAADSGGVRSANSEGWSL